MSLNLDLHPQERTKNCTARVFPCMNIIEILESIETCLTVAEFSMLVKISEKTIRRHIRAGKFPAYRIGSLVRIDPSGAAVWMRERLR